MYVSHVNAIRLTDLSDTCFGEGGCVVRKMFVMSAVSSSSVLS